mmetsp:Transcript_27348/g.63779  ORF Transcript_27348/g.63779 Transcript_27348/m.63779 type:complete len:516 (+) Transcript_27348:124-1671(+)
MVPPPPPAASDEEVDVSISVLHGKAAPEDGTTPVQVSIRPPQGGKRTPADLCCVVDVSGSMGTEAMLQSEVGVASSHGLSVLDVVVHAIKTIIRNLEGYDRLALITYSNEAKCIFGLTPMDDTGRGVTESQLDELAPYGMTNLWDGLKSGLELLKSNREQGRLQHIMLFTDGLPNISPPRGILPMLQRLKDKEGGRLPCTVSTFGFGYELDSSLLSQLATAGCGSYAFIPDAGFVGTVFVNAMANLLVTMAKDVVVTLEAAEGAVVETPLLGAYPCTPAAGGGQNIHVGTLQFGQSKDLIVNLRVPEGKAVAECLRVSVSYLVRNSLELQTKSCITDEGLALESVETQKCRLLFVNTVRDGMKAAVLSTSDKAAGTTISQLLPKAQQLVQEAATTIAASPAFQSQEPIRDLLEDLKGQVAEAFSREDWYTKWGVHYLPSVMSAHINQVCNNFKDPGVQSYGGALFEELRDKADDIFCSSPAPVAKPRPQAEISSAPPIVPAAPIDMAMFNDRHCG